MKAGLQRRTEEEINSQPLIHRMLPVELITQCFDLLLPPLDTSNQLIAPMEVRRKELIKRRLICKRFSSFFPPSTEYFVRDEDEFDLILDAFEMDPKRGAQARHLMLNSNYYEPIEELASMLVGTPNLVLLFISPPLSLQPSAPPHSCSIRINQSEKGSVQS
jgi:hypothetical protein